MSTRNAASRGRTPGIAPAVAAGGRGRDRREDLLSAAAACFVELGLRATTMELIARRAGAGKATLYRYFGNKDEVIAALLDREVERFVATVASAAAADAPAARRLDAAFVAGVGFLVNHPVLVRGRDEDPAELLSRLTSRGGSFVAQSGDVFAGIVRDGIADGSFRDVDPDVAAEAVLRLLLSWFAFPDLGPRRSRPADLEALAQAVVSGGLQGQPGPTSP